MKGKLLDLDWDAYRFFIAVVDSGSFSAAARRLRVSQPTVGRKISELEERLKVRLFERTNQGYSLTDAGHSIVRYCRDLENNALYIERAIAGQDRNLEGKVQVATTDGLGAYWLAPRLPRWHERHPKIEIELLVGTSSLDLMRREADIAFRIGDPGSEDLVGRKIGHVSFGLYGSLSYFEQRGEPHDIISLREHSIIESVGSIANLVQASRLREISEGAKYCLQCNHLPTQIAAASAGVGLLALPCYVGATVPALRRIFPEDFDIALDLWLLTHRDLRAVTRIRMMLDFLAEEVKLDEGHLTGTVQAMPA